MQDSRLSVSAMGRDSKVKRTVAVPCPGRLSHPSSLSVQQLQAERPRAEGQLLPAGCRQQELLQEHVAAGRRLVQGLARRGKFFSARQRELGSVRAELDAHLEALRLQLRALELSCEAARAEQEAAAAPGGQSPPPAAAAASTDADAGLGLLSLIDCGEAELLEMECDILRHQERHLALQLARTRSAADTARLERWRLRMLLQRACAELAALQGAAAEVAGEVGRLCAGGSPPPLPLAQAWAPGAVSLRRSSSSRAPSPLARAGLVAEPPLPAHAHGARLAAGGPRWDTACLPGPVPAAECGPAAMPAPAVGPSATEAEAEAEAEEEAEAEAAAAEALLLAAVDAVLTACVADALDAGECPWSAGAAEQQGVAHKPKLPLESGTGQDHVLSRGRQGGPERKGGKADAQQLWDAVPPPTRKRKGSGGGLVEALGIALSLLPWRARGGDDWWAAAEKGVQEGPPPSPRSGEPSPARSPASQRGGSESERWLQELYNSSGGDGGKEGMGPLIHV